MQATVDRAVLKDAMKDALLELLRERPAEVRRLVEEMIEDVGLARAIEEGREDGPVSREEIEATLRGGSPTAADDQAPSRLDDLYEVLSRRHDSGDPFVSARHNEHQP